MTMRQTNNFSQDSLRADGIFVVDHESDIFVWIGSKVKGEKVVDSIQKVGQAVHAINGKGRQRRDKISFSFVRQGYEPDIFRKIFPRWESFAKSEMENYEISEEDSDEDSEPSGSDDGEGSKATSKAKSTAAATETASEVQRELTADQKKRVASYMPEAVWLNFWVVKIKLDYKSHWHKISKTTNLFIHTSSLALLTEFEFDGAKVKLEYSFYVIKLSGFAHKKDS